MAGVHSSTVGNELENVVSKILYHVGTNINDEKIHEWIKTLTHESIKILIGQLLYYLVGNTDTILWG